MAEVFVRWNHTVNLSDEIIKRHNIPCAKQCANYHKNTSLGNYGYCSSARLARMFGFERGDNFFFKDQDGVTVHCFAELNENAGVLCDCFEGFKEPE
jgi:hypothetical protein